MTDAKILLEAKDIEERYHISYSAIMAAKKQNKLPGTKIGRKFLFEQKAVENWLGIAPSSDEMMELRIENEKLKLTVEKYKNQYKVIKQLLETLNGACNVI